MEYDMEKRCAVFCESMGGQEHEAMRELQYHTFLSQSVRFRRGELKN